MGPARAPQYLLTDLQTFTLHKTISADSVLDRTFLKILLMFFSLLFGIFQSQFSGFNFFQKFGGDKLMDALPSAHILQRSALPFTSEHSRAGGWVIKICFVTLTKAQTNIGTASYIYISTCMSSIYFFIRFI
jgi:hypothetical protein